ncbi:DUF3108 domain-containing protein [Nitrosomonas marina]|uniref:DUF3108 domain-containing protein n=1 Tax=Nitrosomonas marina TaxID=917 RepID=A0A1H8F203_9PROT|nr:DUF3108 domain-containing protein [Nitrosomonas marina]SEN25762.1 Protein of unknown function [Nitrosomonas marina]
MKFLLISLILWSTNSVIHAAENNLNAEKKDTTGSPARIHISYTVRTGIGNGELNETVDISQESDSHIYSIISNAQATGVFKLVNPGNIFRNSQGIVTELGLRPVRYSDERTNNNSSLALFDWENRILTLKHQNEETQTTLNIDTQDRLSLSYHFIFAPEHILKAGSLLAINVTDGRSHQLMQFEVSREKLSTPLGEMETIVLTKQFNQDDKMQRKIWLAPEYHMIPVQIQTIEEDGLNVEKIIAEIQIDYTDSKTCCKK